MSLINDALKKAQKQRTGEAPTLSSLPSIGGERPAHIAKRKAPPGFDTLLLRLGLGVGALVVVIVGGLLLFRGKDTNTPPPATAPVAVTSAPTTPVSTPSPAPATPAPATASAPVSTFVVPNVTPPATTPPAPAKAASVAQTPKTEPSVSEPTRAVVAQAPAPVIEQPKPEPVKPPAPPLKLEPRAMNYIEGLRVAGIRFSATDSKVLMNDRVYRVGDMVEHEMGLKLVGISSSSLTFEDERGGRYTRNF